MTGRKRLRIVVAVLVVGILAIAVGVALAATTGKGGGPITAVKVVRGGDAQTTNSALSYVNLPGASTSISVPSHHTALILVRFSAESECDGGTFGSYCSARVLVDGNGAPPTPNFDFAFDTDAGVNTGYPIWQSSSMDRSIVVGSGNHTVRVQWGVTDGGTTFRLDDWSLTVERSIK
jgi:hypothetical protein